MTYKRRIGVLRGKPIVEGNKAFVTKNEIHISDLMLTAAVPDEDLDEDTPSLDDENEDDDDL